MCALILESRNGNKNTQANIIAFNAHATSGRRRDLNIKKNGFINIDTKILGSRPLFERMNYGQSIDCMRECPAHKVHRATTTIAAVGTARPWSYRRLAGNNGCNEQKKNMKNCN